MESMIVITGRSLAYTEGRAYARLQPVTYDHRDDRHGAKFKAEAPNFNLNKGNSIKLNKGKGENLKLNPNHGGTYQRGLHTLPCCYIPTDYT